MQHSKQSELLNILLTTYIICLMFSPCTLLLYAIFKFLNLTYPARFNSNESLPNSSQTYLQSFFSTLIVLFVLRFSHVPNSILDCSWSTVNSPYLRVILQRKGEYVTSIGNKHLMTNYIILLHD